MQSVSASWSGMRALKKLLGHFGIHLKLASEVALKEHVNEFTVPLTEPEESVAAAEDDLVDVLHSRQVKALVKHVVSEMEKVPTPAALAANPSGVAAPTGAEYVVLGQIAGANWVFLLVAANARAACVRGTAEKNSLL
jgi:hypothetical protein